ncbi:MAG TPA: enoyl-CoA hydratase-related protein, partial [Desulfomonilaceae bacterium]|nr:enoyl-CoA hydratase-related protein [Desulfomonilaceae bacterium]
MDYRLIKCEKLHGGAVFKIVLAAPKANILEAAMLKEISAALDDLEREKGTKLLIFEGEGKHFSFGASVPEHTKDKAAM